MTFELLPILNRMIDLYEQPATMDRFNAYLKMLSDAKGDLILPLAGFNPMAKEHVLGTLKNLEKLDIEWIMTDALKELNQEIKGEEATPTFKTAFNLSDDLRGGWTNRYTSDYEGKFKLNPLLKRNFCVPVFWTSEKIDIQKIRARTREYCYRTLYALNNVKPKTLDQHFKQELFVCDHTAVDYITSNNVEEVSSIFEANRTTEEFTTILNFFYGDQAAIALGNKPLGMSEDFAGFRLAKYLSDQKNSGHIGD